MLRLLDQTGMHKAEAVNLDASNLDQAHRRIRLLRTKTRAVSGLTELLVTPTAARS